MRMYFSAWFPLLFLLSSAFFLLLAALVTAVADATALICSYLFVAWCYGYGCLSGATVMAVCLVPSPVH